MVIYVLSAISQYSNEFAELLRAFYPNTEVKLAIEKPMDIALGDIIFDCQYQEIENSLKINITRYSGMGETNTYHKVCPLDTGGSQITKKREIKNQIKLFLYDILNGLTGHRLDWGTLTGVRPTKIVHNLMDRGLKENEIAENLCRDYRVSIAKTNLLLDIAKIQRPYFAGNKPNKISIYVNIPICPSKCLFCSFPSAVLGQCKGLIDDYIKALEKEMRTIAEATRDREIEIETVYIGGGTPTSLDKDQLQVLLESIHRCWDGQQWKEFTVEGGRPDTMDKDKLEILKEHRVNRISINPQSMVDKTLKAIGRNHTSEEIIQCFYRAREIGFDSINMDVIVGLLGEGIEDTTYTMEKIKELSPDNFTLHTLAIKRASRLKEGLEKFELAGKELAEEMIRVFYKGAIAMGMRPYYLYRQKYMLGNLENVGFATPGKESIYNMQIMEDRQTIWGFGAAAMTKVYFSLEDRIERAANVKNIEEYIKRVDEMAERKNALIL